MNFPAMAFQNFLLIILKLGILKLHLHVSPMSNGRAEVAVKTATRLLAFNTGPTGRLDNDWLLHAMLQLCTTADLDCSISSAQIVFGCPLRLRDTLSFVNTAWAAKENFAFTAQMACHTESLNENTR